METVPVLTYRQATDVVSAALAKANELGVPSSVAVVDAGRELVAFGRQDGALLITGEVAIAKAYTARSVNRPTEEMGPLTQPGGEFWGLEGSLRHPLVTFGGGRPLVVDGEVVGAIGVGGGTADDDIQVAAAGAATLAAKAQK